MRSEDLKQIIDYIDPASLDYEDWLAVGMAMQYEGFSWQDWDAWSMADSRYVPGDCERRWSGFSENKGNVVTGGTIAEIAKNQGCELKSYDNSSGRALSWDSTISAENLNFIDSAWVEGVDIVEPNENWNPKKELITYLQEVFEPDEFVGFNVKSHEKANRDGEVKHVPSDNGVYWKTAGQLIQELQAIKGDDMGWVLGDYDQKAGAWIRFNPLDGKGVRNENVSSYRYALIESDDLELDKQLALIQELELPCKAIVSSGGKSIHAIVHIGAKSYPEYQNKVEYLYKVCEANGFILDKANKNPSRLSRMPGVYRNGKKQFIIATNKGKESFSEWEEWIEDINDDMGEPELPPEDNKRPILAPELIEGILRTGHKMLLSGPSKAGKSFMLIGLGLKIALGQEWLGRKCMQGNVLYVNLELDEKSAWARVYDILEEGDKTFDDLQGRFKMWNLRGHAVPMDKLAPKLIRRAEKDNYAAVIIDPIYKVLTGDENNAKDMADFTNQFDKIATQLNCAVIYCHHHSKGYQGQKRSMDRSSGSGVFARDPDAILDMTQLEVQPDERDDYGLIPGATAWRMEATLREFASPESIDLYFEYPVHVFDENGALKELVPESEKPVWQRGNEKSKVTKQKKSEKQKEQFEMEFSSYSSFNQVDFYPLSEAAKRFDIGEQAMRNRIDKYEGYYIKNAKIYKTN